MCPCFRCSTAHLLFCADPVPSAAYPVSVAAPRASAAGHIGSSGQGYPTARKAEPAPTALLLVHSRSTLQFIAAAYPLEAACVYVNTVVFYPTVDGFRLWQPVYGCWPVPIRF